MHESSFGIFQQLFNHGLRFISVRDLSIDHIVVCVVSAEYAAYAEIRRIFPGRAVTLTRLDMHKDRPGL